MSAVTFTIYEDLDGSAIICQHCKYHSRDDFDVSRKHCPRCRAYHVDGKLLVRNVVAERGYRTAWVQWCIATNPKAKLIAERSMDGLQPCLGHNTGDPRYYWFVRSLPGFIGMWEALAKKYGQPPRFGG